MQCAIIFSKLTSSLKEHSLFQKDRWSQNNNHVIIIWKRITSKNDQSNAWTCDIMKVLILAEWRRSCTDPAGVAFFLELSLLQNSDSWLIWLLAYPVHNIDIYKKNAALGKWWQHHSCFPEINIFKFINNRVHRIKYIRACLDLWVSARSGGSLEKQILTFWHILYIL